MNIPKVFVRKKRVPELPEGSKPAEKPASQPKPRERTPVSMPVTEGGILKQIDDYFSKPFNGEAVMIDMPGLSFDDTRDLGQRAVNEGLHCINVAFAKHGIDRPDDDFSNRFNSLYELSLNPFTPWTFVKGVPLNIPLKIRDIDPMKELSLLLNPPREPGVWYRGMTHHPYNSYSKTRPEVSVAALTPGRIVTGKCYIRSDPGSIIMAPKDNSQYLRVDFERYPPGEKVLQLEEDLSVDFKVLTPELFEHMKKNKFVRWSMYRQRDLQVVEVHFEECIYLLIDKDAFFHYMDDFSDVLFDDQPSLLTVAMKNIKLDGIMPKNYAGVTDVALLNLGGRRVYVCEASKQQPSA